MEPVFSFIEYLVGGSVGLLWLIPLVLHLLDLDKLEVNDGLSERAFALFFAYALGIFLDRASSFLLNPASSFEKTCQGLKKLQQRYMSILAMIMSKIRKSDAGGADDQSTRTPEAKESKKESDAYLRTIRILALAPESLAQTTQAYVGRERIARVMLLNSVAGLMVALCIQKLFPALHILLALAAVWSLLTWAELHTLSEQFKKVVINEIDVNAPKED
jgi:hypothetical protein